MSLLLRLAAVLVGIAIVVVVGIRVRYGGEGGHFEDRTGEPELPASALEVVADLDLPPGNIAVSADGRVFFSFHPEARPPVQVAELVDGEPVPYPPKLPDELAYQSVCPCASTARTASGCSTTPTTARGRRACSPSARCARHLRRRLPRCAHGLRPCLPRP